jgi:hypothetical protein
VIWVGVLGFGVLRLGAENSAHVSEVHGVVEMHGDFAQKALEKPGGFFTTCT